MGCGRRMCQLSGSRGPARGSTLAPSGAMVCTKHRWCAGVLLRVSPKIPCSIPPLEHCFCKPFTGLRAIGRQSSAGPETASAVLGIFFRCRSQVVGLALPELDIQLQCSKVSAWGYMNHFRVVPASVGGPRNERNDQILLKLNTLGRIAVKSRIFITLMTAKPSQFVRRRNN